MSRLARDREAEQRDMSESDLKQLAPILREPAVRHVHRELRRAILTGQLASGHRLVETSLADRLKVSRTPVREALQRLESEGLVRRLPKGGFVVEDMRERYLDVIQIREAMECVGVRLACVRAGDDELSKLVATAEADARQIEGLNREQRVGRDRAFHARLAELAHSPPIVKLVLESYEFSFREIWRDVTDEIDLRHAPVFFGHHVTIARAVASRDGEAAAKAVRAHLTSVAERLENSPAAPRREAHAQPLHGGARLDRLAVDVADG